MTQLRRVIHPQVLSVFNIEELPGAVVELGQAVEQPVAGHRLCGVDAPDIQEAAGKAAGLSPVQFGQRRGVPAVGAAELGRRCVQQWCGNIGPATAAARILTVFMAQLRCVGGRMQLDMAEPTGARLCVLINRWRGRFQLYRRCATEETDTVQKILSGEKMCLLVECETRADQPDVAQYTDDRRGVWRRLAGGWMQD